MRTSKNIALPTNIERAVAEYRKSYHLNFCPYVLITDIVRWLPTPPIGISNSPGCYAAYKLNDEGDLHFQTDLSAQLVYVGKASRRPLWKRLQEQLPSPRPRY